MLAPCGRRRTIPPVIPLTRLRSAESFLLNPDLFERVDTRVDTVVRLNNGTEYVVVEPADEILRRIIEYRARVLALAAVIQTRAMADAADAGPDARRAAVELVAGVE